LEGCLPQVQGRKTDTETMKGLIVTSRKMIRQMAATGWKPDGHGRIRVVLRRIGPWMEMVTREYVDNETTEAERAAYRRGFKQGKIAALRAAQVTGVGGLDVYLQDALEVERCHKCQGLGHIQK